MKRSEFMLGGQDIESITACQAMENKVRYCHPDLTWKDITSALIEGGYGSLPVVDNELKVLGLVSEYDLLKVIQKGKDVNDIKAKDMMTKKVISVTEDTPIKKVIDILEDKHLIRVPVVKDSKLVGIITRRDVLLCVLKATAEPPHWV